MKCIFLLILILFLTACARAPEGIAPGEIDPVQLTIYHNGVLLTMDENLPVAQAIAIRGEFIEQVGSSEEILALQDSASIVIDLGGRVLMPGFVDAHTHLLNDHRSQDNSLDEAQVEALRNGITTLGTLYVDQDFLREIQAFDEAGFLRVRTSLYLVATDPCGNRQGDWWKKYPPTQSPGEMLRINGVKIFSDGGSCGRVALSFELEPGSGTGDLWYTQDELTEMIAEVNAAGYQAAVHAIGDRAVVQALNAYETVLAGQPNILRNRMEHVSVIPPEDVPRFGELGIIPVVIGEYPNCTPYGDPIPFQYSEMEWPWRALGETNPDLAIAWHTDVPFQSINPFDHMLGFVTRIDTLGRAVCPPADWLLDDTLSIEETLSILTLQSAYSLFRDDEVGSLTPNKYADFIVLANNPLQTEPDLLAENRVLLTVVGGRTEYCWPSSQELCPGFTNRKPVPIPDLRPPVLVRWMGTVLFALLPIGMMLLRKRNFKLIWKIGGWAGVISGVSWLVYLTFSGDSSNALMMLPPFLMAMGVAGLAALLPQGKLGKFCLWMALIGAIFFSEGMVLGEWFRSDVGWALFVLGLLSHTIGLFLFGLVNLKGDLLTRWKVIPMVVGLFGGPIPFGLGFSIFENSDLPFNLMIAVLGMGWFLMGLLMIKARSNVGNAGEAIQN